ncbi:MAG: polysaccharide deacetylase family protein [Theionarchaea archaeon]|nr:polysaccharide deacetylase family protein [Theionarchaea archaeon]
MNLEKTALILVLMCGFLLSCIPLASYEIPLSWEGFYHARIAQNFAEGEFYDTGSFGPEGRPSVYPPAFHVASAFSMKIFKKDGFFLARWVPPFMFCALIVAWYYLISHVYQKSIAVISSLFLLAVPAFLDLGFLFSPHSFALILVFLAFIFVDRPVISGICGGIIIMTQFSCGIFFFLVLFLWAFMDSKKRTPVLKITGLSLVVALPYLGYFLYNTPTLGPILGNPGLKYFFMKTTFGMTACALLGLRKDAFAASLCVSGFTLSMMQPTNFSFLAFPLALFSAFFIRDFFSKKKWSLIAFIFLFWFLFIPSQEYVSKLQPAASEYESFVWLKENSVESIIASGWYQAPIIAFVSERVPVLGFGFPEEKRLDDTKLLYEGDETLLDFYDVSYVYFGKYEEYDYNSVNLSIDKVYSGKGSFFKREPPLIYVLITIDVEPDLPPILNSYHGIEEGFPIIVHLLDTYDIPATFFVLGETAQVYPDRIKELAQLHEIGCHSFCHEDLRALSYEEKEERVIESTSILQELAGSIVSFRAPGHSCDNDLIKILIKNNYLIEASADNQHFYPFYPLEGHFQGDATLLRIPVSHTPSYFYAPLVYPHSWVDCYSYCLKIQHKKRMKVIVIGLHPWEFISLEAPGYTMYTQACGEYTQSEMERLLRFLHKRRVQFVTMRQLYDIWET